jgi:hypothetical protein
VVAIAQVVKGIMDSVHEVALKVSRKNLSGSQWNEVALLKSCRNSNIVQVRLAVVVLSCVWKETTYVKIPSFYCRGSLLQ